MNFSLPFELPVGPKRIQFNMVMAGLDPAIPIVWHGAALFIGIAGSSPAMTP
jgi:hypothetical protein